MNQQGGLAQLPQGRIFDQSHYELLNTAREKRVRELLGELNASAELRSAIDVGCGIGYFSGLLHSLGFEVLGVDGRGENSEEAKRRVPEVRFAVCNAEDPILLGFGSFDLVFCFGLLYHLENPLLAIRHLKELTKHLLLVESVIFPGEEPTMALLDEGQTEDQGMNHVGFYPTEACLIKLLYRVGFSHVYRFANMPDHPEYHWGRTTRRTRTMLAASTKPLTTAQLVSVSEPSTSIKPWDPSSAAPKLGALHKLEASAGKSLVKAVKRIISEN